MKGAVAAGHPETAQAAAVVLEAGGNAFDAIVASVFAACVAEPMLASLGGGGFLMAQPSDGDGRPGPRSVLYDFFAHTPGYRPLADALDFFPIEADFGTARQVFHIGLGAAAVPGMVRGLFAAHRAHGSMPMVRLMEPAIGLARQGVRLTPLQAYLLRVLSPICLATAAGRALYAPSGEALLGESEILSNPELADFLDVLAREGERLFYEGEVAHAIVEAARAGGTLRAEDLASYRVVAREPLQFDWAGASVVTNPPPSAGGILIAFALRMLDAAALAGSSFGSRDHVAALAAAMDLTQRARLEGRLHERVMTDDAGGFLDPAFLDRYRLQVLGQPTVTRGTTHVSVIDAEGNAAALSVSNGEGCGHMIPGTGVMLNNMLGEEDLQPQGFNTWPTDRRLSSMMAPTLVNRDGPGAGVLALGSGGSNRIRTAILQVLVNRLGLGMDLGEAVGAPRIHLEGDLLSAEAGWPDPVEVAGRAEGFGRFEPWDGRNLFFGGVHAVSLRPGAGCFDGAGDPRRGGVAVTV